MPELTITLSEQEHLRLLDVALVERRPPEAQAAYLVVRGLENLHQPLLERSTLWPARRLEQAKEQVERNGLSSTPRIPRETADERYARQQRMDAAAERLDDAAGRDDGRA